MTDLDRLLQQVSPVSTVDIAGLRIDTALNTFEWNNATITRWAEYEAFLSALWAHIEFHMYRLPNKEPPDEYHLARCHIALNRIWGAEGYKYGMLLVQNGQVLTLIRAIGEIALKIATERWVKSMTGEYYAGLSPTEQLAASQEFMDKCGHLLQREWTDANGLLVKARFTDAVMEYHNQLVSLRTQHKGQDGKP